MISFKGRHFWKEMILQNVRWYPAYSLSHRDIEEVMQECGFDVHHSAIQANTAAFKHYNHDHNKRIKIRQCKYLNNIVEQYHRRIKRLCRPMLGLKNFDDAQKTLAEIELMRMIKKRQTRATRGSFLSPAEQFYTLAA